MAGVKPREKSVRRAIRKELVQLGGYWMAIHGSPYQPRTIDIVGCLRGRFVGLELKRPKGKPTSHQRITLKRIQDAGGIAGVVRSKAEVRSLVRPLTSSPACDNVISASPLGGKDSQKKGRRDTMSPKKRAVEAEEEEDLEDLEDLGEEMDDEAEETEAKSRRRSRKAKATAAPKTKDGIGVAEVSEAAGVTPAEVRRYLRSEGLQSEPKARYHWPSLSSTEVKSIVKALAGKDGAKAEASAKGKAKSEKAEKGKTKRHRKGKGGKGK